MTINSQRPDQDKVPHDVDIVIVGGGAAGCVLAARLSEDNSLKVLLLEAGKDMQPGETPDDIADVFPSSYANPNYFFEPSEAVPRKGLPAVWYPQARVIGGGSAVTGMLAPRGLRADFDAWSAAGAIGWGSDDLLPYFRKLETDLDFPGEDHGDCGPIPIIRRKRSTWPGFTEALGKALEKRGITFLPDLNGTDSDGLFEMPCSNDGKRRFSSAYAYLTREVRSRPNLWILGDTTVSRIKMHGKRAIGVDIKSADGTSNSISAAWTIVSAGAIYSPLLLLQSGIGPADHLAEHGIETIVENAEVGRNLQNHPYVHLGAVVKRHARHDPRVRSYLLGCARLSTGYPGAYPSDLFMGLVSRSGPRARDVILGMVMLALYSPFSRGRVSLSGKEGIPHVYLALLEDDRDKERLVKGARIARDILQDDLVQTMVEETFVLPAKLPMRLLNQPGLKSSLFSLGLAALLDMNGSIRSFALKKKLGEGRFLSSLSGDKAFDDLILSSATSMAHPAGTCAIGKVVDTGTALKGAERLFVADASIMPKVPRANTNISTVMVAEKSAVEIRRQISGR